MLTANVDVSDGLVNGARGEVVHIVTNNSNYVTSILVVQKTPLSEMLLFVWRYAVMFKA